MKERKEPVFAWFNAISKIPRNSGDMTAIGDFVESFAKERHLAATRDTTGNVIVRKPASAGYETAPGVILQCHMDMVCVSDNEYDFSAGIRPVYGDEWVTAQGTTLGGDNGIGMAYVLAVLDDDSLCHPAIEGVFTVDEETSMVGALGMDLSALKGHYLINLDSEEEGFIVVSSAGGLRCVNTLPVTPVETAGAAWALEIKGLRGGHSGMEINRNRVNAITFLGRVLAELGEGLDLHIADVYGGVQDNAIPAEAGAELVFAEPDDRVRAVFDELSRGLAPLLADREPGAELTLEKRGEAEARTVLDRESRDNLLFLLNAAPNGVQRMNAELPGFVDTSLNLGVARMADGEVRLGYALRSAYNRDRDWVKRRLALVAERAGAKCTGDAEYPAWELRRNSPLQRAAVESYRRLFDREAELLALHAGLECSTFADRRPDLDIISIGPDLEHVHSPRERLNIASALRVYDYLLDIIQSLRR